VLITLFVGTKNKRKRPPTKTAVFSLPNVPTVTLAHKVDLFYVELAGFANGQKRENDRQQDGRFLRGIEVRNQHKLFYLKILISSLIHRHKRSNHCKIQTIFSDKTFRPALPSVSDLPLPPCFWGQGQGNPGRFCFMSIFR